MTLHQEADRLAKQMGYSAEAARETLIAYYRGEDGQGGALRSTMDAIELRKLTIEVCRNGADFMSVDDFVAPEPVVEVGAFGTIRNCGFIVRALAVSSYAFACIALVVVFVSLMIGVR